MQPGPESPPTNSTQKGSTGEITRSSRSRRRVGWSTCRRLGRRCQQPDDDANRVKRRFGKRYAHDDDPQHDHYPEHDVDRRDDPHDSSGPGYPLE